MADLLVIPEELEALVSEHQANVRDSSNSGKADAVALAILMADRREQEDRSFEARRDWLSPSQVWDRWRHEVPVSNESFRNVEKGRVVISHSDQPTRSHVLVEVWPLGKVKRPGWGGEVCDAKDCEKPSREKGLCRTHQQSKYEHPHLWCCFEGCGSRDLVGDPVDEDIRTVFTNVKGERTRHRIRTDVRLCRHHHALLREDTEWFRAGGREYLITKPRGRVA